MAKICLALLVLFVAAVSAKTEVKCDRFGDGFVSDPDSCDHFYRCVGGRSHYFTCPEELHWNKRMTVCDYPQSAGCSLDNPAPEVPEPEEPAKPEEPKPEEPKPEEPKPEEPKPEEPKPEEPKPEEPKPEEPKPEEPKPEEPKPEEPAPVNPPAGDRNCKDVAAEFHYKAIPGSCTEFYKCSKGAFVADHHCGEGLNFSEAKQACVTPNKAPCA